jgi:hypothetical protein
MYCCAPELIGFLLRLKVWVIKVKLKRLLIQAIAGVQIPSYRSRVLRLPAP